MPKYTITFTASPTDAKALLNLAVKALTSTELSELHFTTDGADAEPKRTLAPHHRYAQRTGVSGPQVAFELLRAANGKMKREVLRKQLVAKGYAPASVEPFTSKLKRDGLVEYNNPNYYLTTKGQAHTWPIKANKP